jgi:lipoprotein signal peptidase
MSTDPLPTPRGVRAIASFLTFVSCLVLDQASKALVRSRLEPGERHDVVLGMDFTHVHNTGIAFGLFAEYQSAVLIGTLIVGVVLFVVL